MPDIHLVQSTLKGDHVAFHALVDKYQKPVHALVLSRIRDETQAQDLTQETFIRAYMNLESLTDRAKFGPWISGIARNVTYKWLNRRRELESLETLMSNYDGVEPDFRPMFRPNENLGADAKLQQEEMRQLLWCGIYTLDSHLREVLVLFYLRRMKRLAIAEFLGISEAAVRNRLHKGRKVLKKEILQMLEQNTQTPELPDNFTARVIEEAMQHGENYLSEKSWEKAKREFQRAIDVQEDYAAAYRGVGLSARGQVLEQLDQPKAKVDSELVEEAYTELSRAYRLGAKDWDTVWTLGKFYEQFGRCDEQVQIFLDYSQTAADPTEAFKAGVEAAHEMGALCTGNYIEAINLHRQLLKQYADTVPPESRFLSFGGLYRAYIEAGRLQAWLKGSESLEAAALPKISLQEHMCYKAWRCDAYHRLGRYDEAIQVGEEFVDFIRKQKTRHPCYRWYVLDAFPKLLPNYKDAGQTKKLEEAFHFIESTLADYESEWQSRVKELEGLSGSELREWDKIYADMEDLSPSYPIGKQKAEIREWLDETYRRGLDIIYHNIGCGFAWIGEDEKAIRFFERKRSQSGANHYCWLAYFVLRSGGDPELALTYLKHAATDRRSVASGVLREWFEREEAFERVRNDPRFQVVMTQTVL